MLSRKNAGFVVSLLTAIFITSAASGESVYFVGGGADDGAGQSLDDFTQWPHDGFVMEHLVDGLNHDVFYSSGDNSTTAFATQFDLLVISATLGSGSVRGKFHTISTPILQWEEALLHVQDGNFPITVEGGDANNGTDARAREIVITDNTHFITDGFPLGPIEIAKDDADQDIAMPFASNIVEEVSSLAIHPDFLDPPETIRHVLTAFDAGTEWADNTIAPMRMVNFPIQDNDFGNLNPLGLALFDRSIEWLLPSPPPMNWPGDANGDGHTDVADLNILGGNWRMDVTGGIADGDFNEDGIVDSSDLNVIGSNWQTWDPNAPMPASVPEPSSVVLALAAISLLLMRRRR